MEQLRAALDGPHGAATTVTWALAGTAILIAIAHAVRRRPHGARWSRGAAVAFPAAAAWTLLVASVTPRLQGGALEVSMFLRMVGFWGMVITAPFAVGQLFELRPPTWLRSAQAFLVPVASFAGWWLLACLGQVRTRTGLVLFALGGSITTLALVVAALVVDPVLADQFLVVDYLPVLAAASLLELQRTWSDLPRQRRPERTMATTSQ